MPVPNSFANVTTSIPLSQLDANFNTPITLGNTAIQLGNTVSTLNNMTLANVTVTSGNVTITNVTVTTANVTTANIGTSIITTSETLNYGTANQVQFLNASKVLTGSANLTFDGTTLTPHTLTVSTGVLTVPAGSNTAPSITTSGDTNTGIFYPAADTVAIGTGGTERLRVDSAGNSGFGVTPPATFSGYTALNLSATSIYNFSASGNRQTHIYNNGFINSSGNAAYINTDAASRIYMTNGTIQFGVAGSGSANANITFTQAMTLYASGNLSLGNTTDNTRLHVTGLNQTNGTAQFTANSAKGTNDSYVHYGTNGDWYIRSASASGNVNIQDTGGNVGIGTSSPSNLLQATKNQNATTRIAVTNSDTTNTSSRAAFQATSGTVNCDLTAIQSLGGYLGTSSNHDLNFVTNGSTRATVTSGGIFLVGKTTTDQSIVGLEYVTASGYLLVTASGGTVQYINRITNDGNLVEFRQDGITEGTISVSGTTVSYNGGHLARWSQLLNGQRDESILKGTVLSNLDEMCEWFDAEGNPLPNEQLNRTKVSDVEGDTNVAGVFVNWDNDDNDNPYDMNIAMTGDMIIRIAQGITVQKGDLLMSAGDGTAKPQGDDIVRSKTVAKVTSNHVTCTYDDGSYCVPCVLMAC